MTKRDSNSSAIYIDARCLQDGNYQFRGVGYHISALLRTRPRARTKMFAVIGLIDPSLGPIPEQYTPLFDDITSCVNPILSPAGSIFIDASPMTHDLRLVARFMGQPLVLNLAIVYDFIPLDWPGYLQVVSQRVEYLARLVKLRNAHLWAPISEYSANRLRQILGVDPALICVTGAPVRQSLLDVSITQAPASVAPIQPFFLTVGGGDKRKNTETAVRALKQLNSTLSCPARLKIVGHYDPNYRNALLAIAEDNAAFIDFCPGISDAELARLYSTALATIVPSYIEGFSLPVVEAATFQSPVLASDCAAHLELLPDQSAIFPAHDSDALARLMARVLVDSSWTTDLKLSQSPLSTRYHEHAVGARFWTFVVDGFERRFSPLSPQVSVLSKSKPKIAFLSPFPPDESGVARFTEMTIRAAARYFDIDLYTNALRPLPSASYFTDCGPINSSALLKGPYTSIISVIGNSHFHLAVLDFFERYGGPCIMHDSRLTAIYHQRLGPEAFRQHAAALLRRPVSLEDVALWLQDQDLPSLFIEPIIERARPMIVHTRQYQDLLKHKYNFDAALAVFPPNMSFEAHELGPAARIAAKARLGLPTNSFCISTFGFVAANKGAITCLLALEFLRSWNIPAELYFVGFSGGMADTLQSLADKLGIAKYVHLFTQFVSAHQYREYMIASDVAIALRTYGLGQPAASLADCISAGLPTVASAQLADSCDAPFYVRRLTDPTSPVLLAEQIADILDNPISFAEIMAARSSYCDTHNFDYYARRLRDILALA